MKGAKKLLVQAFSGNSQSIIPLVLLGCVVGVVAGIVMASFVTLLNLVLGLLNGASLEDFESLTPSWRFGLPVLGSCLLILLYRFTPSTAQVAGLPYVLERLHYGSGRFPWKNTVFQFFAALISLGSGHSVGREGPAVHLGSGIASLLGQYTHRPPSQLRLLVGCGTAAAISAAFNTPLAGVLFAMEVVLMEYSILGFAPIIAAAISASAFTGILLGPNSVLSPTRLALADYGDIPSLLFTGVWIGLIAVLFHQLIRLFLRFPLPSRAIKLLLAGLITGSLALLAPEILGSGYDTINATLSSEIPWSWLLVILAAKLIATAAAIGLGVPGGQIAPMLVLGVCAGGLAGALVPGDSPAGLYALLGMAAMMAAMLHAPLAALATILELSLSAEVMFPGMTVVLTATMISQHVFRQPSLMITMLKARGRFLETHPLRTALAQRYLSELVSFRFAQLDIAQVDAEHLERVLALPLPWIVVHQEQSYYLLSKQGLEQAYLDYQQQSLTLTVAEMLTPLLTANRVVKKLDTDASLLTALKSLEQQEEVAGFLLPTARFGEGLVTRRRLMRMLTLDNPLH